LNGVRRLPGDSPKSGEMVTASAPIRICDLGGWTDTWFSRRGKVFNIAVSPSVDVRVQVRARSAAPHRIDLEVANFGDQYGFEPGEAPGHHPLIEAVIDEVGVPDDVALEIRVASDVPAGCSMGTSATVAVALIGALDALTPQPRDLDEVARAAHRVEVERLGWESGVQDQVCAAFGGINFIEIDDYPVAVRSSVRLRSSLRRQLEQRLLVFYLGVHRSSQMHERVISALAAEGADAPPLEELRACAVIARDAAVAGDLEGLGRAMTRNTDAQRDLHDDLLGARAEAAIEVAASHGASGWKLNGAGGEGGSITVLGHPDAARRRDMGRALVAQDPAIRFIPTRLSEDGLRVWRS
jgi:D-glycero-alpha-D-manno-heptose-7-phosphate kinase